MEKRIRSSHSDNTLGARLKQLREARNLSAAAMAHLIGVPDTTYREWEKNRGLRIPPVRRICEVLQISLAELLLGETVDKPKIVSELDEIESRIRELKNRLIVS